MLRHTRLVSSVYTAIVTLFVASVAFAADPPTPAEVLAEQVKNAQTVLAEANAKLASATLVYANYKPAIDTAESKVESAKKIVLWFTRRLQPFTDHAAAEAAVTAAAAKFSTPPTKEERDALLKAEADVAAADKAIDDEIEFALKDSDVKKAVARGATPKDALTTLKAQAESKVKVLEADRDRLVVVAKPAFDALVAAQKNADAACQRLATLATPQIAADVAELRKEVSKLSTAMQAIVAAKPAIASAIAGRSDSDQALINDLVSKLEAKAKSGNNDAEVLKRLREVERRLGICPK